MTENTTKNAPPYPFFMFTHEKSFFNFANFLLKTT